ncbi:MAG TPA: TetR/AcrR family transcriptional regulator [Acidimicrobiales bacterium]|jgi:AcrR family transcriptional regulator|nr:TetR/AcrR family transcriptional regulator [Acidimicrobiales bacterium]
MSTRLPAPARRRQLLDVALRRFATAGYHATSMDDVAEAAGVTKPVLYQHFSSKRDLYLQLLDDVSSRLVTAIDRATREAPSPRAQVEAGFAAYLDVVVADPDAFRLLFGSGTRRDEEFADAARRVEQTIARAIAALIDADIDDEQRVLVAHAIVGMAEGAVRERLLSPEAQELDAPRLARQLADLAWGGLRGVRRI